MIRKLAIGATVILLSAAPAVSQQTVPLYNVTVIEHSLQAVNYQYRSGPTEIDFRGTVLLPKAKGHATVESHRGRTEIDAKLQGLTSPQAYGREYLTYVLWAISPEGAARNLCEIVSNGSDDSHVHVTTELQAFGLLVTAEPYAAVRQPSDVVVLENQVRPETIGKIVPIQAKAELLPRGHYVLDKQNSQAALAENAPKVSMGQYEQLSQIYQAENALALARTVNADKLAADTYAKAQQLLDDAKQKRMTKAGTSFVVQSAREAAQTADDARVIALKRAQEGKLDQAEQQVAAARQAQAQAETAAQAARADADAARAQAEAERAARERAETTSEAKAQTRAEIAESVVKQAAAEPPPVPNPVSSQPKEPSGTQAQFRMRLIAQLKAVSETRDTPRGIVITIPDSGFSGANLLAAPLDEIGRIAQILGPTTLQVAVEGNTDNSATEAMSGRRAEAVRDELTTRGVPANRVTARGLGNSRLTTSNASEAGRIQNRRVEIVVSGSQIGDSPLWNRSYSLSSQ
jgi:outer membrane protein OmpA-like peptidoglycan-associated protein